MNFDLDSDAMAFAARTLEEEQKRTLHLALEAHLDGDHDTVTAAILEINTAMKLAGQFRKGHTAALEAECAGLLARLGHLGASLKDAKSTLSKAKAAAKAAAHQKVPTHR
ncbi:MAG: hypothetical protein HY901_07970 [Deltaproteobacteria bacterium]|nr:hypothetical protein [Deltaproteobacteria bacterium]